MRACGAEDCEVWGLQANKAAVHRLVLIGLDRLLKQKVGFCRVVVHTIGSRRMTVQRVMMCWLVQDDSAPHSAVWEMQAHSGCFDGAG